MIYSKAHNFVAIRNPKCGSTTMSAYLLDSNLINYKTDTLYLESSQTLYVDEDGMVSAAYLSEEASTFLIKHEIPKESANLNEATAASFSRIAKKQEERSFYLNNPRATREEYLKYAEERHGTKVLSIGTENLKDILPLKEVHVSYSELLTQKVIPEGTPCYSTIRHPVERWVSMLNAFYPMEVHSIGVNEISLVMIDKMQELGFARPQHTFFSENPILWNLEDIHKHLSAFILERGGVTKAEWYGRKNLTGVKTNSLSSEITKKVKDIYEKDFISWEKAFRVYN